MSCCKTYDPCLDGKLNQIGSYASVARQSAEASSASATSAAASAAAAAESAEIAGIYLGPFAVAPTTDNDGGPLQEGMLYYNTVSNGLFVWNGSSWQNANVAVGDGDKGDITVSGVGTVWTIDNDSVTYAKMQNVSATDRLLGRDSAGAGNIEELTVSGGVEFTGSGGIQTSAFTGDVTKTAGGTITAIANDAVTFAKMQNVGSPRLLGRATAGTGDIEQLTLGNGLSFTGTALTGFNETTNFLATGTTFARNLVTREADVINVKDFGAVGDGVADDGPAIRAAVAFASSQGGGTVWLPAGSYNFTNYITTNCYQITSTSSGQMVPSTIRIGLAIPARVSLIGEDPSSVSLNFPLTTLSGVCIGLIEYSFGKLSGFKVNGGSSTSGSIHGIFFSILLSDITWTNENITIENIEISNVSAYGIGQQYGNPKNVTLKNIKIENTGADGIDWKVRVGNGNPLDCSSGVIFDSIVVKNPGLRTDLTNLSGIGFRGRGIISNIEVTGIRSGDTGIELVAGIHQGNETRQSTNKTVLTNFYCESTDFSGEVQGLKVYGSGPVSISNGYLKGCIVYATNSAYGYIDGPSINNVIVDGARNRISFRCETDRSSFFNCRSVADKQYFNSDRGNLVAGQTIFPIEYGITSTLTVLKNNIELVSGVDYTFTTSVVTVTAPALITDVFIFIQNGDRPFRIDALYCSIFGGGCDEYYTNGSYFPSGNEQDSTNIVGFYDERFPLFQMIPNGAVQFRSLSKNSDSDLWLLPKGNGIVRGFGPTTSSADTPVTGYITIKDSTGTVRRLATIN